MATCIAVAVQAEEAYLFSYFSNREFGGRSGESAGLHLAYSYDGLKWTVLNDDKVPPGRPERWTGKKAGEANDRPEMPREAIDPEFLNPLFNARIADLWRRDAP